MSQKKKFYAVAVGRKPGLYTQWFGEDGAQAQVDGFANARFKGFASHEEALEWLSAFNNVSDPSRAAAAPSTTVTVQSSAMFSKQHGKASRAKSATHSGGAYRAKSRSAEGGSERSPRSHQQTKKAKPNDVAVIYTDGGSIHNPGPGGYGVVLYDNGRKKELTGGFRLTTNNRMELMACIVGLQALKPDRPAVVHTDSQYVVNGVMKGWARQWRRHNWKRKGGQEALNADLWAQLLDLCDTRQVDFKWIKGHAGHRDNERCDHLAGQSMKKKGLPPDIVYEQGSGAK